MLIFVHLILICLHIKILSSQIPFHCRNFSPACKEFTFSSYFVKDLNQRVESLQQFYLNYLQPRNIQQFNFTIIGINDNQNDYENIAIISDKFIGKDDVIFSYYYLSGILHDLILPEQFINSSALSRKSHPTLTYFQSKILEMSKSLQKRNSLAFVLLTHASRLNESIFKDYIQSLPFFDLHIPFLHFDEYEITLLKEIDAKIFEDIRRKRMQYRSDIEVTNSQILGIANIEGVTAWLNYPKKQKIQEADFFWARWIVDVFGEVPLQNNQQKAYLLPGTEFINDFLFEKIPNSPQHRKQIFQFHDKVSYGVKLGRNIQQAQILQSFYSKSFSYYFINFGKIAEGHPEECIEISLWNLGDTGAYKPSLNHYMLYKYIPFPNFGMCYSKSKANSNYLIMLARLVNYNDHQASDCYGIAGIVLNLILKLNQEKLSHEFPQYNNGYFKALVEQCMNPILKNDVRSSCYPDMRSQIIKLQSIEDKINKKLSKNQQKNETTIIEANKNLNLLKDLIWFKINHLIDCYQTLNALIWQSEEQKKNKFSEFDLFFKKLQSNSQEEEEDIEEEYEELKGNDSYDLDGEYVDEYIDIEEISEQQMQHKDEF